MTRQIANAVFLLVLICAHSVYAVSKQYEKGEIVGALGFSAITLDEYYAQCFANGSNLHNNLKGIDNLVKRKFGMTFSDVAENQALQTGRNYFLEAKELIKKVQDRLGGCTSEEMKEWLYQVRVVHDKQLKKFHGLK